MFLWRSQNHCSKLKCKLFRINTDLKNNSLKNKSYYMTLKRNYSWNVKHNWKLFRSSVENLNWHHSIMQHLRRNRSVSYHQRMSKSDSLSVCWHLHHTITAFIEIWSTLFIKKFLIMIQMSFSSPLSFSATQALLNALR